MIRGERPEVRNRTQVLLLQYIVDVAYRNYVLYAPMWFRYFTEILS